MPKFSDLSNLPRLFNEANNNEPEKKSQVKEEIPPINRKYPQLFSEIKRGNYPGVYDKLEGGEAVLRAKEELGQYLYSYGKMHEAKLIEAFKPLFNSPYLSVSRNEKIEILDYACGQGLATIVLLNYIENNFNYCLSNCLKIILIEPSEIALDRAVEILKESSSLHCINKYFDDLTNGDLKTSESSIKIHLFSNILDMGTYCRPILDKDFSFGKVFNVISTSLAGLNYFVCVSPHKKFELDYFMGMFKSLEGFEEISSFEGLVREGKPWMIVCNIFKVG